jgi:sugar lactone lactonase YvrE
MVPMLFMSSAFFTNQLMKTRGNMEVSYNASYFLQHFIDDLYYAQRILPTSDSTHLYYAYYDPLGQREMRQGYQIVTAGGVTYLQKLSYNVNSGSWETQSPYATVKESQLLLPSSAQFYYCTDSTCSGSTDITSGGQLQRTVLVKLTGWTFTRSGTSDVLNLSTAVDVYVSAGSAGNTGVMLSEQASQLYSFAGSLLGTGANLKLLSLAPSGGNFNVVRSSVAAGSGTLTTISTAFDWPTWGPGTRVDVSGRVYRGEGVSPGDFYVYSPTTNALSILVTGRNYPGLPMVVGPDGRVFFAERTTIARAWTWKPGSALTTLVSDLYAYTGSGTADNIPAMEVSSSGRLYLGENTAPGRFWTWNQSCGLSVVMSSANYPGGANYGGALATKSLVVSADGRAYFGEGTSTGNFYSWKETSSSSCSGGTLTTIAAGWTYPGALSSAVGPGNEVYFGEKKASGRLATWDPSTSASILIIPSSSAMPFPGYRALAVAEDNGRLFFGENTSSNSQFFTWKSGVLTTIIQSSAARKYIGEGTTLVTPSGRAVFGDVSGSGASRLWTWDASTGLTTILPAANNPGHGGVTFQYQIPGSGMSLRDDGRLLVTDETATSKLWGWSITGGLTTILSNGPGRPGETSFTTDRTGRFYFGTSSSPGPYWTWHESTGLSTILSSAALAGFEYNSAPMLTGNGGVCFNEDAVASSKGWCWTSAAPSLSMGLANFQGAPSGNTVSITMNDSSGYTAADMDGDGNLYYLDTTNKTVDAYTYGSSYSESTSFDWSTWAGTVNAIAVDSSNSKIALLDTSNKQVDIYSNRNASGTPSAPTSFSISSVTLPTGIEISDRTGNILVLDSNISGSGSTSSINLFIYNSSGTYQKTIPIVIGGFSPAPTAETDFRMMLDTTRNILYLVAPNVGYIYAVSMPDYL